MIWLRKLLFGSWVLGADVSSELLVALLFVVSLHVLNGFANEWPRWIERPGALGASPALKARSFGPYQFAMQRLHSHLAIWCRYARVKYGAALVFDDTATAKAALFPALNEVLLASTFLYTN
jgi:hypothetical protein